MLDIVTFTGIDTRTPFSRLLEIHQKYPLAEFGILVSSHTGRKSIYPPMPFVLKWRDFATKHSIPAAIHLCGVWSRMALDDRANEVISLCEGFSRVQLNIPQRIRFRKSYELGRFVESAGCKVILQHSGSWTTVPIRAGGRLEYLYDQSGGRGIFGGFYWPSPPFHVRVGYAGGIGPETIRQTMEFISKYPRHHMWLDMEGRVRTDEYFDLEKVLYVLERISNGSNTDSRIPEFETDRVSGGGDNI